MSALFAATAGGASTLQKAGAIAAIVGASIAVILFVGGIVGWWWRHRRVRSVKVGVRESGDNLYLAVTGLPPATATVTALVSDGSQTKRLGPADPRPDISPELLFNLRDGQLTLDESVKKYKVQILTSSHQGDHRRPFKKKVRTPW